MEENRADMGRDKQKVIITGATGTIGIALIKRCYELGWESCAIVRPGSLRNRDILNRYKTNIIECNLSAIKELSKNVLCQGADYFIHLGWCGTFGEQRNDTDMQLKNVQYAMDACETAHMLGCEAFLFAGSQAEFGRVEGMLNEHVPTKPETAYGAAKLEAGHSTLELCKRYGLRHLYFRILSVYGPGDGMETMVSSTIRKLKDGISPRFTKGEQLWDYLYSDDAAQALISACKKGKSGKIYCLGSGKARPLHEYIEQIGQIVNPEVALKIGALPYRDNQVMYLCADISDLIRDLEFAPRVEFKEGIKRTLASIEEHTV